MPHRGEQILIKYYVNLMTLPTQSFNLDSIETLRNGIETAVRTKKEPFDPNTRYIVRAINYNISASVIRTIYSTDIALCGDK